MFTRVQAYLARDRERRTRIVEGHRLRERDERTLAWGDPLEPVEVDDCEAWHGESCPGDCAD